MSDRKILVFYIGIGNMPDDEVGNYVTKVQQRFLTVEFINRVDSEIILLPVRDTDSRIECINPKFITKKALVEQHEAQMKELNDTMNQVLVQLKADKEK